MQQGMKHIEKVRRVNCYETTDYRERRRMCVQLFVADMDDGSHYYTSVGGYAIFVTEENIDSSTDIIELHDVESHLIEGSVWDEPEFIEVVERLANQSGGEK